MMNTLESFLAPARVSDWMACAHVRRCPNWQCWWDEDSVVAASGLTEDDERNLQADKMRSKARARKLAKSRSSFSPFLPLSAAGSSVPGSVDVHCVSLSFVISFKKNKQEEGATLCPEITFLYAAQSVSRSGGTASLPPACCGLWLRLVLSRVRKFHVWWETPLVLSLISTAIKERNTTVQHLSSISLICSFRFVGGTVWGGRFRFPESYQESCRNG